MKIIECTLSTVLSMPLIPTCPNFTRKNCSYRTLSRTAETKDFARLTSHPVRGWTGKNKAFCSRGTQNGRHVIKV